MKSVSFKKSKPDPELLNLQAELLTAQGELSQAYRRFDQAVDPELVEACIYEINAVTARCNYLLRVIKERSGEAVSPRSGQRSGRAHQKHAATADSEAGIPGAFSCPDRSRVDASASREEEKGDAVWT